MSKEINIKEQKHRLLQAHCNRILGMEKTTYTESKTDVAEAFAFHKLNEQGMIKSVKISNYFQDLLNALNYSVDLKDGRLKSIVITKLEEACFYAKKAMATDPANQA